MTKRPNRNQTTYADPLLNLRAHQVTLPNRRTVRQFLEAAPSIAEFLPPLCERLRCEFGPKAELSLELYRDPEIDDEYLTLYVRETHYGADILDRIDERPKCWEKNSSGRQGPC
jgi:hypothetical protein